MGLIRFFGKLHIRVIADKIGELDQRNQRFLHIIAKVNIDASLWCHSSVFTLSGKQEIFIKLFLDISAQW